MTGWVMVQNNDGSLCYTAHATEEEAYKDIVSTVMDDWSWIGLDPDDDVGKIIKDIKLLCRVPRMFSKKEIYKIHMQDRFDTSNGFNMTVEPLGNIESLVPILANVEG